MRDSVHYLFAGVVLSIYGTQICPFLDTLSFFGLAAIIFAGLGLAYVLHLVLTRNFVTTQFPLDQARYQFRIEVSLFITAGLLMALYNYWSFGFPAGSGMKLVVGCSALGLFAAMDLALDREHVVARHVAETDSVCFLPDNFFPLTKKFALFSTATTVAITGVLILVINHDLTWISNLPQKSHVGRAIAAVAVEIIFVVAVIMGSLINIIWSYARNLRLYFDRQQAVLHQATRGDLTARLPVATSDEFGKTAVHVNQMIGALEKQNEKLQRTRDATLNSMAGLAETRDPETGRHIERTQEYVHTLAEELQAHPRFQATLTEEKIERLRKSAPLHDIGKVGVPDAILLKPGELEGDEWEEMKKHTDYGRKAIRQAEEQLKEQSFLSLAREIAYTHHEKWNGEGYPRGLVEEEIPVSGRIMALADVYDALISKRVYKDAFTPEKAREIIEEDKGKHFDPAVVEAFLNREADFREIATENPDT